MCDVDSDDYKAFMYRKEKFKDVSKYFKTEEQYEYFTMLPLSDKQRMEFLQAISTPPQKQAQIDSNS